MIKCPECGQEISDKAKKCVHCGRVLIEDKPVTKICSDCGKENPIDVTECIHCGCPFEEDTNPVQTVQMEKSKKDLKKIIIPVIVAVIVIVMGLIIYNVKVVKPKNTYNEAMELLEKGKYEEANDILESIKNYKDVTTIQEQLKYESYAYSTINDLKKYLKNPDSFQPYEVKFYASMKSKDDSESVDNPDEETENLEDEESLYPTCVIHYGAQNGFGGNTTGYVLGYYSNDEKIYEILGTCNSLDEDDYDLDDEDDVYDLIICKLINSYVNDGNEIGDIDLSRLKTVLKNDAYSTIKIIE